MIVSPYHNTPDGAITKTTAYIDSEDLRLLKAVYPGHGNWQAIIGTWIKCLVQDCKKLGLTNYAPDNGDKFEDIVRRRTAPQLIGCSPAPDEAGRTEKASRTNKTKQKTQRATKHVSKRVRVLSAEESSQGPES